MKSKEIFVNRQKHKIVGIGVYSSVNNPNGKQVKVFLEGNCSLMYVPEDNLLFFGRDEGEIKCFNGFPPTVIYNGQKLELVNHDNQIEDEIVFGITEGECEFWDYEGADSTMFVSVAVLPNGKRSDVVLHQIDMKNVQGLSKQNCNTVDIEQFKS